MLLVSELIALIVGVVGLVSLGYSGSSDAAQARPSDAAQARAVVCRTSPVGPTTVELVESAVQASLDDGGYLGPCMGDLVATGVQVSSLATVEPKRTEAPSSTAGPSPTPNDTARA